ncbi:hypothetical protein ACFS5M_01930 [Lacinutrix iliipiscaria]|uniref:DUF5723 domain-containing protein n=1 Tax=Lacinutrix iliipiscaria TaxID=1230532 RepID=A0ABW5WJJ8_9FLAO
MRPLLFITIFILVGFNSHAQDKLNSLQTPSSPAASILELQPNAILAPKSYEALETTLYSNFVSENSVSIPDEFAMEFTPYWTKNHGLTISEYLYPKKVTDQLIRNTSFSIASSQNFFLGDSTRTNAVGLGLRTSFHFYNNSDKQAIEDRLNNLRTNQKAQASIGAQIVPYSFTESTFNDFWTKTKDVIASFIKTYYPNSTQKEIDELLIRLQEKGSQITYDSSDNDTFLQAFMNIIDTELLGEALYLDFMNYMQYRYGLSIDIAYSNFLSFPTNTFEFSFIPKQAIWITPTYKFKNKLEFLKVLAVFKYEWYNLEFYEHYFEDSKFFRNNFDYGISLVGEFRKFSIQFEAIGRKSSSEIPSGVDINNNPLFRKESNSDFQYIGTFSYNLRGQINISYSLGNRFENVVSNQNTLVSFLGLNFGFGTPDTDDLKEEDLKLIRGESN